MKTISLTPFALEELNAAMKNNTRDWKKLRRLKCIQMRNEGKTLAQITTKLEVSEDSVTRWCEQYLSEGVYGLCGFKYDGRRPSVLEQHKSILEKLVDDNTYGTYAEYFEAFKKMVGGVEIKWDGFYKFCKKNSI
jgi:transposase